MTRKNYVVIAEILSDISDSKVRHDVAEDFVRMFEDDGTRFDADRFREAVHSPQSGKS